VPERHAPYEVFPGVWITRVEIKSKEEEEGEEEGEEEEIIAQQGGALKDNHPSWIVRCIKIMTAQPLAMQWARTFMFRRFR